MIFRRDQARPWSSSQTAPEASPYPSTTAATTISRNSSLSWQTPGANPPSVPGTSEGQTLVFELGERVARTTCQRSLGDGPKRYVAVYPPPGMGARRRHVIRGVLVAFAALALAGCANKQNALAPASKQEHAISHLWWVMMTGAWIGFAVIVGLLTLGWVNRRKSGLPRGGGERAATLIVIVLGTIIPIVVVSALFVYSDIFVIDSTAAPSKGTTSSSIDVVGHQWFWEIRYPGTKAVTANEIHIPVRSRVEVVGTTADVIHSFWVPRLNRKIDLIPGRVNRSLLQADRTGVFRGQCAEFCGLQHAHMSFWVFVDNAGAFRSWLAHEAAPASAPRGAAARAGQRMFVTSSCASCHEIRGTGTTATVGPDLTHLAGRTSIAALTLPNAPSALASWIHNPQASKPGDRMPDLGLQSNEVSELVAYLQELR